MRGIASYILKRRINRKERRLSGKLLPFYVLFKLKRRYGHDGDNTWDCESAKVFDVMKLICSRNNQACCTCVQYYPIPTSAHAFDEPEISTSSSYLSATTTAGAISAVSDAAAAATPTTATSKVTMATTTSGSAAA